MVTVAWLRKTELFESLEISQLEGLLSHSSVESFPQGKTIFRQGDEATSLYVLMEGEVELTAQTGEKTELMTTKIDREGSTFGMPSLIEPFRYNVTATSSKVSKILVIDACYLRDRFEEDPKMGMEVMKKLALIYFERLNRMRLGVSNLLKMLKEKTR
jgi:CRP-like cAMP-binding protein